MTCRIPVTLALVAVALLASTAKSQTIPPNAEISIPFEDFRKHLPRELQDGEIITHVITKNKWPKNKTPFERNETVEIALGRAIRAKQGDRKHEHSLGPGLVAKQGYVAIKAGWRAHYSVDVISDYFDGVLDAKLGFQVKQGKVSALLYDVKVKWNGGLPIVGGILEKKMAATVTEMGNKAITEKLLPALEREIDKLLQKHAALKPLREHVYLQVQPKKIVLQLFAQPSTSAPLPKFEYKPPHVKNGGDADYDGAPHVKITASFFHENNSVFLRLHVTMRERESDYTTASGNVDKLVYQAGPGWKVEGVVGPTEYVLVDTVIPGHSPVTRPTLLGDIKIFADRKGQDAGVYSKVECKFDRKIQIALKKVTPVTSVDVPAPRTLTVVPKHTGRGDLEFDGNGPRVWLNISIRQVGDELRMGGSMDAEETVHDWSTAKGTHSEVFYKAPPGWKIRSVSGVGVWPVQFTFPKNFHRPITKPLEARGLGRIGSVEVFGDRKGKDIEHYTRMVASVNHTLRVTLEKK